MALARAGAANLKQRNAQSKGHRKDNMVLKEIERGESWGWWNLVRRQQRAVHTE